MEVAVGRGAAIRIEEWEHAKDQVSGERNDGVFYVGGASEFLGDETKDQEDFRRPPRVR